MKKLLFMLLILPAVLFMTACGAEKETPTAVSELPSEEGAIDSSEPAFPEVSSGTDTVEFTEPSYTDGGYGAVYAKDEGFIRLGEGKNSVLTLLGDETYQTEDVHSCTLYSWVRPLSGDLDIAIYFDGDTVASIVVAETSNYCLYSGITAGDSVTTVKHAFGAPVSDDGESLYYLYDSDWIPVSEDEAGSEWNAIYLTYEDEAVTGFCLYCSEFLEPSQEAVENEETAENYDGLFEDAETAAAMLETMIHNQLEESWPGEYAVSADQDCVNLLYYYDGIASELENNASAVNDVVSSLTNENLALLNLAESLGLKDYAVNTILLDDTEEEPTIENALVIIINGEATIRPDL